MVAALTRSGRAQARKSVYAAHRQRNRAMRILMLTQTYAPVVGGEERVVEELSTELVDRGHHVAIATLRQPGGPPIERPPGARVRPLRSSLPHIAGLYRDGARHPAPPAPDPTTVFELRRLLREERPDIVHAHNWLVYSYLPLDRPSGPALVLSLHDYGLVCATKRFMNHGAVCTGPGPVKCVLCAADHYGAPKGVTIALAANVMRPSLRKHVDIFLPISEAVRDHSGLGRSERHRVIPDFLTSLPAGPAGDARLERLPDQPFILFFGDATVDKGAWDLAEAYAALEAPPPLVFVGRCLIDGLADRPGVEVVGQWPHELAIEAVRRSLFAVAPSVWPEPFGLVALETAAAGKPVIASDTGGLRDLVVHGETGLLVPPGDRDALRAAIERMLADGKLRAQMGGAATRHAARFSADVVVPQFEDAYRVAIEAREAKPR
jgi:glycosyltransferase involved in cell wall biosynthesis